ncbi:MAG: aldolase, partial [Brachybacterium sp.]|nr:aldolase [Brachybacterium sp.]
MSATDMQDVKHAGTTEGVLGAGFLRSADQELAATDDLLERCFPGDPGTRQPVHTVYAPADTFTPDLARAWGERALAAVADGGLQELAATVAPAGTSSEALAAVVTAVEHKLRTEPIEDLR